MRHELVVGRTLRPTLDDVFGPGPWRFAGAVIAFTLPALMTMELFDTVADGRRLNDVADLLGGSAWLGLSMTIPIAALVSLAVRSIAKLVMSSHHALVSVFGLLLALLTQLSPRINTRSVALTRGLRLRRRSILSRRSGKCGPPLRAAERKRRHVGGNARTYPRHVPERKSCEDHIGARLR